MENARHRLLVAHDENMADLLKAEHRLLEGGATPMPTGSAIFRAAAGVARSEDSCGRLASSCGCHLAANQALVSVVPEELEGCNHGGMSSGRGKAVLSSTAVCSSAWHVASFIYLSCPR